MALATRCETSDCRGTSVARRRHLGGIRRGTDSGAILVGGHKRSLQDHGSFRFVLGTRHSPTSIITAARVATAASCNRPPSFEREHGNCVHEHDPDEEDAQGVNSVQSSRTQYFAPGVAGIRCRRRDRCGHAKPELHDTIRQQKGGVDGRFVWPNHGRVRDKSQTYDDGGDPEPDTDAGPAVLHAAEPSNQRGGAELGEEVPPSHDAALGRARGRPNVPPKN